MNCRLHRTQSDGVGLVSVQPPARKQAHASGPSLICEMRTKGVGRRTAHSVDLRRGGGDRRRPVVEHGKLGAVGRKVVVCTPRRRIRTKPSTRVVLLGWCYSLTATCAARPLLTKISVIGRSTSTRMSMVSPVSTLIVALAWLPPAQSSKARNQPPSRRGNHGKNSSITMVEAGFAVAVSEVKRDVESIGGCVDLSHRHQHRARFHLRSSPNVSV